MEPNNKDIALINFVTRDAEADVIGYLNFPPCKQNDKQYEIFNDNGTLKVRYKGLVKILESHLTVYDKWKLTEVALLNNWKTEPSHAVIELIAWDNILQ